MTADRSHDRLHRSYLRLMRAYPRWHRNERGAELLTTLLDDARPGQKRATLKDAIDLILSGLRARFRPPWRFAGYAVAIVLSGYLGLAGAAVAVQLTDYPGPPTEAQAIAAARAAMPQEPHNVPGPPVQCDIHCPGWDGRDDVMAIEEQPDHTDRVMVWYRPEQASPATLLDQARERLVAAGWQVGPVEDRAGEIPSLAALKEGIGIGLSASSTSPGNAAVTATVIKDDSSAAAIALIPGFAGGLLCGWLVVVWALHRARGHRPTIQIAMGVAALPGLAVAGLTLAASVNLLPMLLVEGVTPKDVQLPIFVLTIVPAVAVLAGASVLLTLGLAALPGGFTITMRPSSVVASPEHA